MDTQTLQKFDIFSGLSPRALNGLAGIFVCSKVPDGSRIIVQNDFSDGVYLLLKGKVAILRETKVGALVPIYEISEGGFFGTISTLDGGLRGAHCIARGEVECGFLQKNDFIELTRSTSSLGLGFQVAVIRAIFSDIRRTNEQLAELSSLEPIEDLTPIS